MRFSVGFVAISLALAANAVPATLARDPIHIPLRRRNDVTNLDSLRNEVSAATYKIRRGFEAYERNTGSSHPLASKRDMELPGIAFEPLKKDGVGNIWQGEIEIGTPSKPFIVEFQTGISEFWVAGPSCGKVCDGHAKYDPSSKSSKNLHKSFDWSSLDGNTVSGDLYSETVKIQDLTVSRQTFGAGNTISAGYWLLDLFPTDGILGLGWPETSTFNATPVFHNLIHQRRVALPVFGLKLKIQDDSQGSEITLGGVNPELYKEPFHFSKITTKGYWQIDMEAVSVNGKKAIDKTTPVIIDSGIRLMIGNTDVVRDLMSKIPGAKDGTETIGAGYWSIPCDSPPTMSLTFAGKSWDIPPAVFNIQPVPNTANDCVAGINGAPIDHWIVGDVFLRSVYTVFDVGLERIGFAEYA